MEYLKGTSVFCGIGNSIEEICKHLDEAAANGVTILFTSLQLPEADKDILLRDFPKMTEHAHKLGIKVDTDISRWSAEYFGIDYKNLKEIKKFGVDIVRLDFGFKLEETAQMTFNEEGLEIEMNATDITEEKLQKLCSYPLNKENLRFCHNYYPMPYTGQSYEETLHFNSLIHKYGFKVSGFIPSNTHHRIGCSRGLPTMEHQRYQSTRINVQEGYLCGFDDILFGDDFASKEELETLNKFNKGLTVFRMKPIIKGEIIDWFKDRVLYNQTYNINQIIRVWERMKCPYNVDDIPLRQCTRGAVAIIKSNGDYKRHQGVIFISKVDLPLDDNFAVIGYINEEDLTLVDRYTVLGNDLMFEIEE